MKCKEIIKHLKKDVKEIKESGYNYIFRKYIEKNNDYFFKIDLCINVNSNDSAFNKPSRKIQFKTITGANKLINAINKEFVTDIRRF